MAFEKYILPDTDDPKMPIHALHSIMNEYARGEQTKANCLAQIELILGVTLTTNEKSDLQGIMDAIDAETGIVAKLGVTQEIFDVVALAEIDESTWYDTKAKIKTRFSWL